MTALASCDKTAGNSSSEEDKIMIVSPAPAERIRSLSFTKAQESFAKTDNVFAVKCMKSLAGEQNMIFSPLSLKYALAMTANGADGETMSEILEAMGIGTDELDLYNEYCNLLMNQLPALNMDTELKLTDAVICDDRFRMLEPFVKTMEERFYAPVEYMDAADPDKVVGRINEWASRCTGGFINPFLDRNDIPDNFAAAILNALYFKSKWQYAFNGEYTLENAPFYFDGGGEGSADYMAVSIWTDYCRMEGYSVLSLPFDNNAFAMYILLPDEKGGDGLKNLIDSMTPEAWNVIFGSMQPAGRLAHLRIPKFQLENKYNLEDMLQTLGIVRAFDPFNAEFGRMINVYGDPNFYISNVIQKARINIDENGAEAGAASAVIVVATDPGPDENEIEEFDFFADHPFAFAIASLSGDIILFEGIYTGKE